MGENARPGDEAMSAQEILVLRHSYQSWKRLHWCRSKVNSAFEIAALMSVFSLTVIVEIPLPVENKDHPHLMIAFVSTSSTLVAVTVLIRVMSMSIIPHLDIIAEMSVKESITAPHDQIINWIFLTCFLGHTIAPILFCLDLILISWLKFPMYAEDAPVAVTVIMAPMIGIILVFGVVFYKDMQEFKISELYIAPFPDRRYSEIAEDWENGSILTDVSTHSSSSLDEESALVRSQYSVTSYGAVRQGEYVGSICSVFADV